MTRRASDRRLKLRGSNGVPTLVVNQMSLQTTPPQRGNWRTRSNDPVALCHAAVGADSWQPGLSSLRRACLVLFPRIERSMNAAPLTT